MQFSSSEEGHLARPLTKMANQTSNPTTILTDGKINTNTQHVSFDLKTLPVLRPLTSDSKDEVDVDYHSSDGDSESVDSLKMRSPRLHASAQAVCADGYGSSGGSINRPATPFVRSALSSPSSDVSEVKSIKASRRADYRNKKPSKTRHISKHPHGKTSGQKKQDRRYVKKENNHAIAGQLKDQVEDAQGAADGVAETKQEKNPPPDKIIPAGVRAVDFYIDLMRGQSSFTAWDTKGYWLMNLLRSVDKMEGEFKGRTRKHVWEFIEDVECDQPIDVDQRPVNDMGFDTLKKDPQLMSFSVSRVMRWSMPWSETILKPAHETTARSVTEAIISGTIAANILARDGPAVIAQHAQDRVFLESRYAIVASTVNTPISQPSLKDDTISFILDFSAYLLGQKQMLPDSQTPYFHRPPLIRIDTQSHTGIVAGSLAWVTSTSLYGMMSALSEVVIMLALIFLVYLSDAISRGLLPQALTLMTSEHWSVAYASGLGANVRQLTEDCWVSFVALYGAFFTVTLDLLRLARGLVVESGSALQIILSGVASRYFPSGPRLNNAWRVDISVAQVSLREKVITIVKTPLRKLEQLIAEVMHLKHSVARYLRKLRNSCTSISLSLNTCLWLIELNTLWNTYTNPVRRISRRIIRRSKRIFTRRFLKSVSSSFISTCSNIAGMGKSSQEYYQEPLQGKTLLGLVAWMCKLRVAECRETCVRLSETVSQTTCSWRSRASKAVFQWLGLSKETMDSSASEVESMSPYLPRSGSELNLSITPVSPVQNSVPWSSPSLPVAYCATRSRSYSM